MYPCIAYGLKIHSELPLLDPVVSSSEPDVTVRFGILSEGAAPPNQGNQILVGLPSGLKLLIQKGREVVIEVPPQLDIAIVRAYILGAAMACILRQRGFLVLHASCVAQNNKAIAFLGGSGWGKSTLASLFHQQGYALLTDDVMAIQINNPTDTHSAQNLPMVVPSFPEVRLLSDAAAAVGLAPDPRPRLQSLSTKHSQRLQQFAGHPVPLAHLYVLRIGQTLEILPVPSLQAFTELVQHSRATKTMEDPKFRVQHFHQCSNLIKSVPMSYLQRPRSLAQLPKLVEQIESHLELGPA